MHGSHLVPAGCKEGIEMAMHIVDEARRRGTQLPHGCQALECAQPDADCCIVLQLDQDR